MVDGKLLIEKLLVYAKKYLYLSEYDVVYKRNQLLMEFRLDSPSVEPLSNDALFDINNQTLPDKLFGELEDFLRESGLFANEDVHKRALYVMGLLSPLPSEVNVRFRKLREQMGASSACNYLYDISVKNNYVEQSVAEQNVSWWFTDKDGSLKLTVNMSKPTSSSKGITSVLSGDNSSESEMDSTLKTSNEETIKYPSCVLCRENQGYYGNSYNPCRSNLRAVEVELSKEPWLMQYSPYCYFDEHCVVVNGNHVPMNVNADIVDKMFDFIEYIPNYFIGTNADLPMIGGSILTHEHFQGGKIDLPIFSAKSVCEFKCEQYPDVEISLTDWFTCNLRISGFNRITVKEVFKLIDEGWLAYSDESLNIFNKPEMNERHNSITALAHYLDDGRYSVDVVLRNNYATEERPLGIFHVPNELQNIKKDPLGLMEVSGLFVLPSNLKEDISKIVEVLLNKADYKEETFENQDNALYEHKNLIKAIIQKNGFFKEAKKAETAVLNHIGKCCVEMLKTSSVFTREEESYLGFKNFLAKLDVR